MVTARPVRRRNERWNGDIERVRSIEELDLDNSGGGNYTIASSPGQTLTLSSTNGPMSQCMVNVLSGRHQISAPLLLAAAGTLVTQWRR